MTYQSQNDEDMRLWTCSNMSL